MKIEEKIVYLREKEGWSQYELAGRLNVPQQQIAEWESGERVPNTFEIVALSELFSVTTDNMLKDEDIYIQNKEKTIEKEADIYDKHINLDEAREYIDNMINAGKKIAFGVLLCIISPVVLIQLGEIGESGVLISENTAGALGLLFLFASIALAVGIFIPTSMKIRKYEDIEINLITMAPDDENEVRKLKEMYEDGHRRKITLGVVMCIVSIIPLVVAGAFDAPDIITVSFTSLMLVVVALAVYILVSTSIIYGSFQKLLQEGDYTEKKKVANSTTRVFQKIYWGVVLAAYLLISLLTGRWDMTWIIWPIAGILFGCILIALQTFIKRK